MTAVPFLELNRLSVAYGETRVVWDVSVQIPAGSLTATVGPNGAGKSTLLKAALHVLFPAGQVGDLGEMDHLMTIMPEAYPADLPAAVAEYLVGQGWVRPAQSSGQAAGADRISHVKLTHRGRALLESTERHQGSGA